MFTHFVSQETTAKLTLEKKYYGQSHVLNICFIFISYFITLFILRTVIYATKIQMNHGEID